MSEEKALALFLADELEAPLGTVISSEVDRRAAAELRRLHAENERLTTLLADVGQVEAELAEKSDEVHRLHAENAELLEALKKRDSVEQHLNSEIENHSAAVYEATKLLSEARERRDELLEALENLVNRCNSDFVYAADETVIAAEAAIERLHRAAIARAEGEKT